VDELGIDELQPVGVLALEDLGVLAVEGAAVAAGKASVEDVADDAARERQPVAARLPLLLEDTFPEQPVRGVFEIRRVVG